MSLGIRRCLKMGLLLALLASGCSKSVSKEAGRFQQLEPEPTPTATISPGPTPTATASPSPTPTPTSEPIGCEPNRLGDLPTYAIYTKEELRLSTVTIGKRVAASDADISKAVIGYTLPADKTRTDLATEYELKLRKTKVLNGNATYGKSLNSKKSSALGGITKAPFSLSDGFSKIIQFSNACAGTAPNTTFIRTCVSIPKGKSPKPQICTLHIRGSNPSLNIAEVTAGSLVGIQIISVEVPPSSTLVTNISDVHSGTFNLMAVVFPKGESWPTVYWNFPEAERLSFQKTLFHGTVIAPEAEVTVCGQAGEAGFWSRTLSGGAAAWW